MASDNLSIPITKLQWGLRGSQIFFAFLSMACIAAVIAFDNKFMSASLFLVAHIFIMIVSMFFAALIVGIPHIYLQYGKFKSTARALRVPRTEFVLSAIWSVLIFIVSVAVSIEIALRNCDPNSTEFEEYNTGDNNATFIGGLARNCRTERAGTAFGWFALGVWLGSLALVGKEWYDNRRIPISHKDEVTMHSNSTTSSLEVPTSINTHQQQQQPPPPTPEQQRYEHPASPYQQQQQPQPTPEQQRYGQPAPPYQQQQQPQPPPSQGPGISFPEPKHY